MALYTTVDAPLVSTSIRVAEMMKYTSNTWHALKVCFANEIGNLCKRLGHRQPRGDGHLLPRREAEPVVVLPEAGLRVRRLVPAEGRARAAVPRQGSGPRAAGHLSRSCRATSCRSSTRSTRSSRPARSASACSASASRPAPTTCARARSSSSPKRCSARATSCAIYDKNVSLARLVGANKEYINKQIPHLSSLLCDSIDEVIDESEVIVVGNARAGVLRGADPHPRRSDRARSRAGEDRRARQIKADYRGICW